jgi:hypothetical protein
MPDRRRCASGERYSPPNAAIRRACSRSAERSSPVIRGASAGKAPKEARLLVWSPAQPASDAARRTAAAPLRQPAGMLPRGMLGGMLAIVFKVA